MPNHESAPKDHPVENDFDYDELEKMVAGNDPGDDETSLAGYGSPPDNAPRIGEDDPWYNYEPPFEEDYAKNKYTKDDRLHFQPGDDQYPDIGADEVTLVKKSLLNHNKGDEPRDF